MEGFGQLAAFAAACTGEDDEQPVRRPTNTTAANAPRKIDEDMLKVSLTLHSSLDRRVKLRSLSLRNGVAIWGAAAQYR
jgi:hypothetical protein